MGLKPLTPGKRAIWNRIERVLALFEQNNPGDKYGRLISQLESLTINFQANDD